MAEGKICGAIRIGNPFFMERKGRDRERGVKKVHYQARTRKKNLWMMDWGMRGIECHKLFAKSMYNSNYVVLEVCDF